MKAFILRMRTKQIFLPSPFLDVVWGDFNHCNQAKKREMKDLVWKGRSNTVVILKQYVYGKS